MADGPVIVPDEGRVHWFLDGIIGINGTAPKFRLFQSNTTIDLASIVSDFTICDYSGYTDLTFTFGPQFINLDGLWEADCSPVNFAHDGGVTANDVYGWFMLWHPGGIDEAVLIGQNFDPPRPMAALGDVIPLALNMLFDPNPV